jgi:hypothetical protein
MQVKMKKTITHNNQLFVKGSIYNKNQFIDSVFVNLEKAGVFSPVNSTGAVKKETSLNHAEHKGTDNLHNAAPVEKEDKKEEKPVVKKDLTTEKEPEIKEDLKEAKKEENKPAKSKKGKK